MKKISLMHGVFWLFVCPLLYWSCHKDQNGLPPITMEGNGTFACLVDGKLWLSRGSLLQTGTFAQLQTSGDTISMNIYADNLHENDGVKIFFFDLTTLQLNKFYDLTHNDFHVEYRKRDSDAMLCTYDMAISGNVNLLKFDRDNQIISGTFEFTA